MKDTYEYQIFIGCNDPQVRYEYVKQDELREMVARFFEKNEIDFSMLYSEGGFCHEEGWFVTENSLCISIVGDSKLDIIKCAKNLTMYMNQECSLITRSPLKMRLIEGEVFHE